MARAFSRRAFLHPLKLLAAGASLREGIPLPAEAEPPRPKQLPRYLRPPGAVEETRFQALCDGCGACVPACPHEAIRLLAPGLAGAGPTAVILPRSEACRLCEDLPCVEACDRGALVALEGARPSLGRARLLADRCLAAQGQPCDYCVPACPLGEEALRFEARLPVVGEACVGCGLCEWICPTKEPALVIEPAYWSTDRERNA